jgi:hypothetical protein
MLRYNAKLSNLDFPITACIKPVLLQIRLKPRILGLQIPLLIRDKKPRNEAPHHRKSSPNQEHPLLPLLRIRKRVLDRREDFRPNRCARLTNCGCETEIVPAKGSGEGFRCAKERRDSRTHFAQGVEDSVEDNEKGEHGLDGPECAAENKAENAPKEESEGHGLLASDFVHKEAANDAAGEVEAVDYCAVANVLDDGIVRVELGDDGRGEETKWVGYKVVEKPGESLDRIINNALKY